MAGEIYVFAGTNGAGKSSVLAALAEARGLAYYNPDEITRRLRRENPGLSEAEANVEAWNEGKRQLEVAIAMQGTYAFETTLGGHTIRELLAQAADVGLGMFIAYVGLASPELHISRVQARVAKGGHDIPEAKIRERYDRSRENLIVLLPKLTEVWLYDNSAEADPDTGKTPAPRLVLHVVRHKIVAPSMAELRATPEWAKAIVVAAMKAHAK